MLLWLRRRWPLLHIRRRHVHRVERAPTRPRPRRLRDRARAGRHRRHHQDRCHLRGHRGAGAVGLNYDLGDHEAAYTALLDDINADGGINGRQIEPVYARSTRPTRRRPRRPACSSPRTTTSSSSPASSSTDAVLCVVATHATAWSAASITGAPRAGAGPLAHVDADTDQPEQRPPGLRRARRARRHRRCVPIPGPGARWTNRSCPPSRSSASRGGGRRRRRAAGRHSGDRRHVQTHLRAVPGRRRRHDRHRRRSGQTGRPTSATDTLPPKLLFLELTGARPSSPTPRPPTPRPRRARSRWRARPGPGPLRRTGDAGRASTSLAEAGLDTPAPRGVLRPDDQPYQAAFQACPDIALMRAWLRPPVRT